MTDLKEYRLRIAKAAVEDLDNIYRYISDSADAETAKNVRGQLEAAMRSLRQIPKRQRTFFGEYRRLSVVSYVVIYQVGRDSVMIKGVFHASMDIVSRLMDESR